MDEEQTFTFSWKVKNFSLCNLDNGQAESTGCFVARILNDTAWKVWLYPKDFNYPDFVSFELERCKDGGPHSIELSATIQLIAPDGTPGKKITMTNDIARNGCFYFEKFETRSEVARFYLHKDTLRINCALRKSSKKFLMVKFFARSYGDPRTICKMWPLTNFSKVRYGKVLEVAVRQQEEEGLLFDVRLSIEGRPGQRVVVIEFTRRCDPLDKPLCLNTRITVLDAKGIETEIWKKDQHIFRMRTPGEVWRFPTFISKAPIARQKTKYLVNDVLTLKSVITVSPGIIFSILEKMQWLSVVTSNTPIVDSMTKDMKVLYVKKPAPDVKLRVLGETIPAHRIVLHSRSKKFAEMLDGREDSDNDVIDVPDVDMFTLKRMLKYMYTDEMDDLEYDDAVLAYSTAYKYQMESLQCKCSYVLQSHMNFRNVCSILRLADELFDQDLKNCAIDFMKQYWDRVVVSEEWKNLCKEKLLLAQKTRDQLFQTCVVKHCTSYS